MRHSKIGWFYASVGITTLVWLATGLEACLASPVVPPSAQTVTAVLVSGSEETGFYLPAQNIVVLAVLCVIIMAALASVSRRGKIEKEDVAA